MNEGLLKKHLDKIMFSIVGILGLSIAGLIIYISNVIARQAEDIAAGKLDGQYHLKGDLAVAFQQMTKELEEKKILKKEKENWLSKLRKKNVKTLSSCKRGRNVRNVRFWKGRRKKENQLRNFKIRWITCLRLLSLPLKVTSPRKFL